MKDDIVKTTRSLRAEWNSRNILYSLRNDFQVVYLFDSNRNPSSETERQIVGVRESLNGRKNKALRKVKNGGKSGGDRLELVW